MLSLADTVNLGLTDYPNGGWVHETQQQPNKANFSVTRLWLFQKRSDAECLKKITQVKQLLPGPSIPYGVAMKNFAPCHHHFQHIQQTFTTHFSFCQSILSLTCHSPFPLHLTHMHSFCHTQPKLTRADAINKKSRQDDLEIFPSLFLSYYSHGA